MPLQTPVPLGGGLLPPGVSSAGGSASGSGGAPTVVTAAPPSIISEPMDYSAAAAAASAADESSSSINNGNGGGPMDRDAGNNGGGEISGDQVAYNPTLDLEAYANNYKGLAKINRLLFIADHCPALKVDALQMALTYVQQNTLNWSVYQKIVQKLLHSTGGGGMTAASGSSMSNGPDLTNDAHKSSSTTTSGTSGAGTQAAGIANGATTTTAPPGGASSTALQYDQTWVDQTMKKGMMKTEKLDTDLKHYKSNSIKESIRRGQDDLGEHYLDMGDLMNALKCFSRARDYCTTNKHIISMCFNVIKVSAYSGNWALVTNYVNRAEATPELSQPQTGKEAAAGRSQSLTKLKCAAGLAELANRKYKAAAKLLLQAQFDFLNYPELISPNNVALYGSLCALASFDRQDLQKLVISNSSFKQFLELEPQLNDIIMKFYESKYAACLKLLDDIRDNLLIDLYLAPHVRTLYTMIRNRGLIQYFSPYLSADLSRMARSFNTTVTLLEDELTRLIVEGQIKARIDSHNKILYAKDVDQRSQTFEHAMDVGKAMQQRTRVVLLRAAIHRAGIVVKAPPRGDANNPINVAISNDITVTPTNSGPASPS